MNGPAHFGIAETLLEQADQAHRDQDRPAEAQTLLAQAQVHATLALAAATALPAIAAAAHVDDLERHERLWADITAPGPRITPGPVAAHAYAGVPVR